MSGSPILQDGKIIGAVTHVFISDATKGYGVKEYSYTKDRKEIKGFQYQLKLEFLQREQTSRKK